MLNRHDLTDEQWARLEPLRPDRTPRRGGQWIDHRQVVNGIMWRARTGSPWRDPPPGYGNWKTVYNRHRRWLADGTWAKMLSGLRAGADGGERFDEWAVGIDSTVVRAPYHAARARHAPPTDVELLETLTGGSVELHESAGSWRKSA